MARRALVFGATGAIGGAVAAALSAGGAQVIGTTRSLSPVDTATNDLIAVDPFDAAIGLTALAGVDPFDAVVWAQGTNVNDSLLEFDLDVHVEVLKANSVFVAATLAGLLEMQLLRDGARLCVISSIWQTMARDSKLSYTVSKAALAGLVHSAAADLASRGMLVNAVLPSVTDTAMTRAMLSSEQIDRFASATGFERLTSLDDVANTVAFLCSEQNTGVTGQSIAVDLGYSKVRDVCEFDVTTSTGSYRVTIAAGSFRDELAAGGHDLILADRFFADSLATAPVPAVFVDADEERKNLFEVDRILGEFSEHRLTRGGSVIALGGGIVQDLGTMAASVYMRGISWTYAPTTLMSMADSCIGGKSSLNVSGTKNLAGNIYPPSAVVVDPEFIASLDAEDVVAGLGEAVKIAFCAGPDAFESYLRHFDDRTNWEPLIEGVLTAKKWFIETDEFDRAERRLLNFGHTFGHALEAATEFNVNHGVAIVVGMLAATSLRAQMFAADGADEPLREHCRTILAEVPALRPRLERVDLARFRAAFLKDKKHPPDALRVVLPKTDVVGVEEVSLPRTPEVLDEVDAALLTAIGLAS